VSVEAARIGGAVASLGLAVLLVARPRAARVGGLGAWAIGALLIAGYLEPSGHQRVLAAAGIVGGALALGLAYVFRRWPWALAFLGLACVPARIPVRVGGTEANLLVPLYAVVAAAALLLAWELVRGDRRERELGGLAWPLAAYVAWTGLSLLWSGDPHQGAISILFFYLPFGLLALSLSRLPWNPRLLVWLLVELVAMAIVFAAIGVYQWATRDIFWNPKVIVGNAYAPFFRVNSVFYDPSVYGRFLVIAIAACLVVVLYSRRPSAAYAAGAAIAAAWIGLLFSFSQSSFAALVAVALLLAVMAWRWRAALVVALVAVVVVGAGVSAPRVRSSIVRHSHSGLNHATSGRWKLVTNGIKVAGHHPVAGVGIGDFKHAYAKQVGLRGREPRSAASHDTPVTVAAELGVPGLVLFVWFAATALVLTLRRLSSSFAGRTALVCGVALVAIAVHSLFYNAFFEDPTTWGLFGLAALAVRARDA
jgi:putative inorganic carbon (HCO3(-)) transporter